MGLLLIEGFESTDTFTKDRTVPAGWESDSYADDGDQYPKYYARRSGYRGLHMSGAEAYAYTPIVLPDGTYPTRLTCGFALNVQNIDQWGGAEVFGALTPLGSRTFGVYQHSLGGISLQPTPAYGTSAPYLYTSKTWLRHSVWYYVELDYDWGQSGRLELRVNGQTEAIYEGDTRFGKTGDPFGFIYLGPQWSYYWEDDMYVADDGVFRGDSAVDMLYPATDSSVQMTPVPAAAGNYMNVDETDCDTDVTYVASSTVGHKDIYGFTDTELTGSILGAQVIYTAKKGGAAARTVRSLMKYGGATEYGTDRYPSYGSYQYFRDTWDAAPGGAPWSLTEINGIEAGLEVSG